MMAGIAAHGLCKGSDTVTDGVRVAVTPAYEAWQQEPSLSAESGAHGHHVFSYRIVILNGSDRRVQLLRRRWLIIDSDGGQDVVEGDGVVGDQPVLEPGESYEYGSWCRLATDWGTMEGRYEMVADGGATLSVKIGRFFLVAEPNDALEG
ncbi:MAG: Co2+/Mg2+ efflux protein ApaG [Planctomycetota bacterium]